LERAALPLAIMGLLLACTPMDRVVVAEGSRQVLSNDSGQTPDAVDYPNLPLPRCNVRDNRDAKEPQENDCTPTDNLQNTIAIKVVTKDDPEGEFEKGQTFFCQCGDVQLETREEPVPGNLDELESIAIASQNSTCLVWSRVGGKKECVLEAP
jgi:hypothetical protein